MLAAIAMAASAVVLLTSLAHTRFGLYFDDLGELVVAVVAAGAALWRSRSAGSRQLRRAWILIALAAMSWAVGEALWSWFELGQGKNPFPSLADVGYLGFPIFAGAALLSYPSEPASRSRHRVLDSLMAVGALGLISWETVLTAVSSHPSGSGLTLGVSLAYPISDLLVLMLVVLTLARAPGNRISLALLGAGCAALVLSDSLFAYLTAVTRYDGGAVDLGWMAAFVLIALAAVARERLADDSPTAWARRFGDSNSLLNYAPVVAALAVTLALAAGGHLLNVYQLAAAAAVVMTMLLRQHVMLRHNAELAAALAGREAAAGPSGIPRRLDRPRQPGALPGPARPCARAAPA